ncbi:hypothetical protein ACHAXT_006015 [Thalassiosira profunda]
MPSSSSSSHWAAALAAAVVAVGGLWAVQHRKGPRRRKQSSGDEESDTISVEGSVMVTLPSWAIASFSELSSKVYRSDEEMMSLAIHMSDRNITEGTGGPFGAAIFERHPPTAAEPGGCCTLVSVGVNRVVPLGNSTLHGETVAIQLAQRRVGSFTLQLDAEGGDGGSAHGEGLFYDDSTDEMEKGGNAAKKKEGSGEKRKRQFELFTSCEPCAMCLGATLWSGVSRIVCAATKTDAQAIGFDEGPVYEQSYEHLEKCGVKVTRNVLSEEAAKVLRRYGSSGLIYNR